MFGIGLDIFLKLLNCAKLKLWDLHTANMIEFLVSVFHVEVAGLKTEGTKLFSTLGFKSVSSSIR